MSVSKRTNTGALPSLEGSDRSYPFSRTRGEAKTESRVTWSRQGKDSDYNIFTNNSTKDNELTTPNPSSAAANQQRRNEYVRTTCARHRSLERNYGF